MGAEKKVVLLSSQGVCWKAECPAFFGENPPTHFYVDNDLFSELKTPVQIVRLVGLVRSGNFTFQTLEGFRGLSMCLYRAVGFCVHHGSWNPVVDEDQKKEILKAIRPRLRRNKS